MKTKTKPMDASVIEQVLDEISKERKAAHADFTAAAAALTDKLEELNSGVLPLARTVDECDADLRAHDRFKERISTQVFDEGRRVLVANLDAAKVAHKKAMRDGKEVLAPFEERHKVILEKCRSLASEWDAHQRMARAAGVKVDRFWTPEGKVLVPA